MPDYRIVFLPRGSEAIYSVPFTAINASSALSRVQGHDGAAELWTGHDHLCTVDTMAGPGSMWVITAGRGRTGLKLVKTDPCKKAAIATRHFECAQKLSAVAS